MAAVARWPTFVEKELETTNAARVTQGMNVKVLLSKKQADVCGKVRGI